MFQNKLLVFVAISWIIEWLSFFCFLSLILACFYHILSCNDNNSDGNGKKAIGLDYQNNDLALHHALLTKCTLKNPSLTIKYFLSHILLEKHVLPFSHPCQHCNWMAFDVWSRSNILHHKQINARLFCHPVLFNCLTSVTQFPLQSYEYNPLTGLTLKDFSLWYNLKSIYSVFRYS